MSIGIPHDYIESFLFFMSFSFDSRSIMMMPTKNSTCQQLNKRFISATTLARLLQCNVFTRICEASFFAWLRDTLCLHMQQMCGERLDDDGDANAKRSPHRSSRMSPLTLPSPVMKMRSLPERNMNLFSHSSVLPDETSFALMRRITQPSS